MLGKIKIRIFVAQDLNAIDSFTADEAQSHYLCNVMKCKVGDKILCFDNKNGEFSAEIVEQTKKQTTLRIIKKTRDFYLPPDLWLIFAPLKKDNTDFVIQKATELGVRKIIPVITKNTITDKVRKERLVAQCIEAAEQSRRVDIPEISDTISLEKLLEQWDINRTLLFMDETMCGQNIATTLSGLCDNAAILCGPEGGFTESEAELLRSKTFVKSINLGPRILRAETAAITAVACWQAICGDWNMEK